jgi:hypothetical protein
MRRHLPLGIASRIFEFVLPVPNRDAMLGDLIEEYALRAQATSSLAAARWFWSQTCRSVLWKAWYSLRNVDFLANISIALGVYVAIAILQLGVDLVISKLVAPSPTTSVAIAPVVFLATAAIGGCLTARIRRGTTLFLAVAVMISVAMMIDFRVCTIPVPWWYPFGFLTLGPLAVLIAPALIGVTNAGAGRPAR